MIKFKDDAPAVSEHSDGKIPIQSFYWTRGGWQENFVHLVSETEQFTNGFQDTIKVVYSCHMKTNQ